MTIKNGQWKVVFSLLGAIVAVFSIIAFVNGGVDERIDRKVIKHEAEFEMKQQQTVTEIKTDIATLKANQESAQRQLSTIQEQGKHTQELVEQLIRDR